MVLRPESDDITAVVAGDADGSELSTAPGGTMGRFVILGAIGAGGMGVVLQGFDPELDRKVAIKVLRFGDHSRAHGRLLREAQAMARITHPNVVTVYEVGRAGQQLFIAMEFVDGGSLKTWLAGERTWRDKVAAFVAAGRGLQAIHAAGLVHRDFKPENVLLGSDQRPRVSDFGLAEAGVAPEPSNLDAIAVTSSVSVDGRVVGTPSYMAPEQWRGDDVDARCDQFAFCVGLWTGVFGQSPFMGSSASELRVAVIDGTRRRPSDPTLAPSWLVAILDRGLAIDPDARWPTMAPLLATLERGLSSRRRAVITAGIIGGGAALAAVVATVAMSRRVQADPCPSPDDRLAAVWSDTRSAAVRAGVTLIDPARGDARFAAAARFLDPYAADWRRGHVAACRATRVDGSQSDSLLDLRIRCLDRRLLELDATVAGLQSASDPDALDHAVGAVGALSPLASCADVDRLPNEMALPAAPGARVVAEDLDRRIAALEIDRRFDRLHELPARAADLVAAARRLDHPGTLASALLLQAKVALTVHDSALAIAATHDLVPAAARAHRDRDEAFAWGTLISVTGYDLGRPDEAMAMSLAASAAVSRAGDPVDLRASLLLSEAEVLDTGPRAVEGMDRLSEARHLLIAAGAEQSGSPLAEALADVLLETGAAMGSDGDADGAVVMLRQAIERYRSMFGIDSTSEAIARHNLGETLRLGGQPDLALTEFRAAARINELHSGTSPRLASNFSSIAAALGEQKQWDQAMIAYDRALALVQAQPGATPNDVAAVALGRGIALKAAGRFIEARASYDAAIAVFAPTGAVGTNLPIALYDRAELSAVELRWADAVSDYQRAVSEFEIISGATTTRLAYPLLGSGRALVLAGRSSEAIAPLERALTLDLSHRPLQRASCESWLARALLTLGRDRPRARVLATAARDTLAALARDDPDAADALHIHDRWMSSHR